MKCLAITGVILFIFFGLNAQNDSIIVRLEVSDKIHGEAVQNVNLQFSYLDQKFFKTTGPQGLVQFKVIPGGTIEYYASHPMYDPTQGSKRLIVKGDQDTVYIQVQLAPIRDQLIGEVVVKAPGVPDTVFKSSRLSVADFEVLGNGDLVLLAYPKQLKKGSELLLYDGKEVQSSFHVPGTAEELVRDYRGNAHVVCSDNVFGIHVGKEHIGVSTLEKGYFLKYLAPILDTSHSRMFFSNFNKDYPAFTYFAFDQIDSAYTKIAHIEDELMMELYRSEYKWADVRTKLWAKEKENQTGIDAEIWVGANYFTQSIYYKELYAPLFFKNDTIYIFDYYKDKLLTYDRFGNPVDSMPIYHHYQPRSTGWKNQLIQDRITGEVYAIFDRSGFTYLGRIDLNTGEIREKVRMEFRYVDKITVHNNFVYYVYRPFESAQKKFLYKERLPYSFGSCRIPQGMQTLTETGK